MPFAERQAMTTSPTPAARGTWSKDLEACGVALEPAADGSLRARADTLTLRQLRLQTDLASVVVPRLVLHRAVLRFGGLPTQPSFELLGLRADEVLLDGVELSLSKRPGGMAAGGWRFDALDRLEGALRIFIRDAAWVVDADITMPIADGQLDFDRVVVDHVGPNSAMGISRNSVYIDAPNMGRTDLYRFSAPTIPGATYETRGAGLVGSRITDRGSVDLKEFLEAMLEAPDDQPVGAVAGREVEVMLDRTKLNGELRLGDGAMGTDQHHVELTGQSQGRNRITLTAAVLGQRLVVRIPELAASGARFTLFGRPGRAGALAASIELHATGLSRTSAQRMADAGIAASVHRLSLRDVVLGEVDDAP
jgi:hypothetical protein